MSGSIENFWTVQTQFYASQPSSNLDKEPLIASLRAEEIEDLATDIAKEIICNIRSTPQFHNALQVLHAQPDNQSDHMREQWMHSSKSAVPQLNSFQLQQILVPLLRSELERAFSQPDTFLKEGIDFYLSDRRPIGILEAAAQKIGLKLSITDLPHKLHVHLELDHQLTENSPFFTLIHLDGGFEFSRTTLSILRSRL